MSPAEELRPALDEIRAVDHHAHPLADPGAGHLLADVLSEATDPAMTAAMRDHPSHHRAVRDLARFLGVEANEGAIAELRAREGFEPFTRRLLEACGLAEMLVDDGFRFSGALSIADHAALVPCAVRRVLRIETTAEAAAEGWRVFATVRGRFRAMVEEAVAGGAAGLKTIAAYRCGLELPPADPDDAADAYARWVRTDTPRLTDAPLVSFFLSEALDAVRDRPVPLQVHTGFGDTDLALHRADPSLLRPLLEDERYADVPIVLLHCYPFVGQASYLASVYPNVYLDLSMALTFAAHRGPEIVLEALDLAPASKLLFATDASRLPELFFLGAMWWRDALAGALGRLIEDSTIDRATALRWAELILAGNAQRLYGPSAL